MTGQGPFDIPQDRRTFRYSRKFHDHGHKLEKKMKKKKKKEIPLTKKLKKFLKENKKMSYRITDLITVFPKSNRKKIGKSLERLLEKGLVTLIVDNHDITWFHWRDDDDA